MMLDTISILLALGILGCALSCAMLLVWRLLLSQRSMLVWGIAMGCYGAGILLVSLRSHIPVFLCVTLANGLIAGCCCLVWRGVSLYRGTRPCRGVALVSLLLFMAFDIWFTHVDPDIAFRTLALSVFIVFYLAGALVTLLRTGPGGLTRMEKAVAAALLLNIVFRSLIAGLQLSRMSYAAPLHSNVIVLLSAVLALFGVTCWGLAVILMTLEKAVVDMRAAENASRSAQNLLETIIDNIPSLIYLKDPEGRLLACNQKLADMFGVSRQQALGKSSHDFFPADLANRQQADDMIVLRTGKPLVTDELMELDDGQHVFQTSKLAVRDQQGRINGICGISSDVTEHRRIENRLREADLRLRAFIQSQVIGIVIADTSGAFLEVNDAFLGMLGYGREEFASRGLRWDTITPPEYGELDRQIVQQLREKCYAPPWEKEYIHKDGRRVPILAGAAGFQVVSGEVQAVCFVLDLSERKLAEEKLRHKNDEIEQFIYMVSHDLRSPLVTVKSFLVYLEQDIKAADAEKIQQDLEYIRAATCKMDQLLNEVLEMSRICRHVNPPSLMTFRELASEAMSAVAGQIAGRNVDVRVADVDLTLTGDRPRLAQIWQNLLDNAVKYLGDQPTPRIELGVEFQSAAPVFFVRDNGIGVAPEFRDRIFGMFDKLDKSSPGVGLGLAMVKKIVESYNGRIWVESNGQGQGSCFRFTLPKALA